MKIKLGVIFGGATVEHEISVISAVQAMASINTEKYDIVPIYINKEGIMYTGKMLMDIEVYRDVELLKRYAKKAVLVKKDGTFYLQSLGFMKMLITNIDIAFPIVHGNNVEDGTIQGFLQTLGIPYVGSGILGSALGQDKVIMKQIFEVCDLPIVDYIWFYDEEYNEKHAEIEKMVKKMGYPVVVKPSSLGSSIGITYVKDSNDLDNAIVEAIKYDNKILIEKAVENLIEVNCSVLGNYQSQEASVLEELISSKDFLTYQDKYIGGKKGSKTGSKGMASANRIIPARLDKKITEDIQNYAMDVFKALNLSGVCRIDFLVDSKTKKIYINEPNTIPGSLSFYLWEKSGKTYTELLDEMINLAIKDYKKTKSKKVSFDTNILSNFGAYGVKGFKGKIK